MGPWYLISNYNWHDFITFRTFSPEHIRSDQASLIFQEVMELEEQHGHEFSGEYNIIAVWSDFVYGGGEETLEVDKNIIIQYF